MWILYFIVAIPLNVTDYQLLHFVISCELFIAVI